MQSEIPELSLWGKKSSHGEPKWLPLVVHLADTAEVGKQLWDEWLCDTAGLCGFKQSFIWLSEKTSVSYFDIWQD